MKVRVVVASFDTGEDVGPAYLEHIVSFIRLFAALLTQHIDTVRPRSPYSVGHMLSAAGRLSSCRANEPHALRATKAFKMLLVMVRS